MKGKNKIVISHRCFFPKGAFFFSSSKIVRISRQAGYDGVEFLPTWRVVCETLVKGEIKAKKNYINSLHRDWRQDRVQEAKLKNIPSFFNKPFLLPDWLFPPPSSLCRLVVQKNQKRYKVPVSVTWMADTKNFSAVMLELWGLRQGVNQKQLMKWLKQDGSHGVVVDSAKFMHWLTTNKLGKKHDQILKELLPYVREVHYRVVHGSDKIMKQKQSDATLKKIIKLGYSGPIVVEFGWPDLEDSPFGLFKQDMDEFYKLHRNIIEFIRSI